MVPADWLTVGQAAQLTGLSAQTIRRYERAGRLLAHRTPTNQRRFKRKDVEALLSAPVAGEEQAS